jgi:hypothetical protein
VKEVSPVLQGMKFSAFRLQLGIHLPRQQLAIYLIGEHLNNLSNLVWSVGERDEPFPVPHGRGDEVKHGGGPDQRVVGVLREPDCFGRGPPVA